MQLNTVVNDLPGDDGTTTTDLTLGAEQLRLSTWETVMALFKDAFWNAVVTGLKKGIDRVPKGYRRPSQPQGIPGSL